MNITNDGGLGHCKPHHSRTHQPKLLCDVRLGDDNNIVAKIRPSAS